MNEAQIIEGLKNKDRRILEYFNKRYKSLLISAALKVVKNKMDAEDIVQECMLKILKSIDTFSSENSFKGWLYRIVHNAAITHYNSNKKHNKSEELTGFGPMQVKGFDFSNSLVSSDIISHAMRKLQAVSSNHYMYARLHYIEGMSIREISEDLALAEGTVKSQISRATSNLRQIITEFDRLEI